MSTSLGLLGVGAATAAPTASNGLPASLAKFAHCPVKDKRVTSCLFASMTGTFTIGSTTLTATSPTTVALGIAATPTKTLVVLPTDGTQALNAAPIPLPGGLLGIPGGPVIGPLAVTAQPKLAGLPTLNFAALFTKKGAAFTLPIEVLVANPLLGSNCTIGTPAGPITLQLTDGTTSPPPPNQPVTGNFGTISGTGNGVLTIKGSTLVDNAFAAPGTSNCGPGGILDPIINFEKGLPAAAGTNSATLSGFTTTAPATLIRKYLG